ncbi:hypothetical protein QE152_g27548 [Popillia japonica]|uniref:Uncharacterized protein n=1 Tax=Popillia japonica TaxID=7064 RepID=A0AAW1JUX4_POPJA
MDRLKNQQSEEQLGYKLSTKTRAGSSVSERRGKNYALWQVTVSERWTWTEACDFGQKYSGTDLRQMDKERKRERKERGGRQRRGCSIRRQRRKTF